MKATEHDGLAGTHREAWPGAVDGGTLDRERDVLLTFWFNAPTRRAALLESAVTIGSLPVRARRYTSLREIRETTDARPEAFAQLRAFCAANDFEILQTHWRSAVVRCRTGAFIDIHKAHVTLGSLDGRAFRMRTGTMRSSTELDGFLRAPLGLHQWPRSLPLGEKVRHHDPLPRATVCDLYSLPDADGAGETVAIIQLNGNFSGSDFAACMTAQEVNAKPPIVRRVDNVAVKHKTQTGKDFESALDAQIVGAFAPAAQIVVYNAPNSERGLLDAVRSAIFDETHRPSVISISFGWAEFLWTPVALDILDELFAVAALLGITIVCASGDEGSEPDSLRLDAPATSAFALACGATTTDAPGVEEVWESSSGGFSNRTAKPAWQSGSATGRGTPDLCAQMRYAVLLDGVPLTSMGTSAVAPFIAAATARLNQRLGVRSGLFTPLLYAADAQRICFRPITGGSTGAFSVVPGWNPCSGLGAPNFTEIEKSLGA